MRRHLLAFKAHRDGRKFSARAAQEVRNGIPGAAGLALLHLGRHVVITARNAIEGGERVHRQRPRPLRAMRCCMAAWAAAADLTPDAAHHLHLRGLLRT
ncbi:hypothetical protein, partial [Belnapia moabensis]|uniref:hypothetical protein n=1 Tax=Belnapia moabensis TaxID=365533 RepID=UPI0005B7CB2E